MIDILWKAVHHLWEQRNGQVHGVNSTTQAKLQKEKTHRKLLAIYSSRDQTRHCNRDLFYDNLEAHLAAHSIGALKNWLRVHKPMVKHSIQEAARLAICNMQTLQSYFCPAEVPK
jgi:hypothetical protein